MKVGTGDILWGTGGAQGQLMSSAQLGSRHFLSAPDPWAEEARVLVLELHVGPLLPSSQEQGTEPSRERLWIPGFGA